MQIVINYEAKSVEEVERLLALTGAEVTIKAPAEDLSTLTEEPVEALEQMTIVEDEAEEEEAVVEAEKSYTVDDLTAFAVKAQEQGKLSQIKDLLDEHEVERVSATPADKLPVLGPLFEEIVS